VIDRAVLLAGAGPVEPAHLPVEKMGAMLMPSQDSGSWPRATSVSPASKSRPIREELSAFEKKRILDALEKCRGNQTKAARVLGISRRTLVSRLAEYDLPRPRKRKRT
jgi:DNA-binding NtrC family response regulator